MTAPIRSGKYRLTSGGSSTLPIPMPASAMTDQPRKPADVVVVERTISPPADRIIAATSVGSRPKRRPSDGAREPKSANDATGMVPRMPAWAGLRSTSARTRSRIGETAATAMRRLSATSTMPARTTPRPRQGCGTAGVVIGTSLAAGSSGRAAARC